MTPALKRLNAVFLRTFYGKEQYIIHDDVAFILCRRNKCELRKTIHGTASYNVSLDGEDFVLTETWINDLQEYRWTVFTTVQDFPIDCGSDFPVDYCGP